MKRIIALFLLHAMLCSICIAWAIDDVGIVDNSRKTVVEVVYGVPDEFEQTEDNEVLLPVDNDSLQENETLEETDSVPETPIEEDDSAIEDEEQSDLIMEDGETDLEDQEGIETEEQPLVTTPSSITIIEGIYSIDGKYVDFDTSIIQPFGSEFNINPNNGGFTSSPVIIRNTGATKLVLRANSCISIGANTPRVVSPNKFRNWLSLGRKDTAANIALGFQIKDRNGLEVCSYWFDDESRQTSEEICIIQPGEQISIKLIAKHGMSWVGYYTFQYRCLLEFQAIPMEIQVEGQE